MKIVGENAEESPYVAMTAKLIEAFPHDGGKFQIEPDASSCSYFWAAARLSNSNTAFNGPIHSVGTRAPTTTPISVPTTHAPYVLDRTIPWVGTIHSVCYSGIQEPIT